MRDRQPLASREFFLLLLPLFFALHGYVENKEAMQFSEAMGLWGQTVLVIALITLIGFLNLRSFKKAALFAFCLLFFHLFFGPVQDTLKAWFTNSLLSKYAFVIPVSLGLFVALLIFLRRTKRSFIRLSLYLNGLFLLLILIEVPSLFKSKQQQEYFAKLPDTNDCDTCSKPDIYFIIADEYADSASLQQIFGFNNQDFQNALRKRGFHIVQNSRSNYNFTPFAVASLLQMNYISGIEGHNSSLKDKNRCYDVINRSPLWRFLEDEGYEVRNHSIFNLANIPTKAPQNYILIGKDLILSQTFLSRLEKDLRFHLATTFKIQSEVERFVYFINRCNGLLLGRLLDETTRKAEKPRFVYTHLTMPHYPYYFNKDGKLNPIEALKEGEQVRQKEYIEYLQYSNKVFLTTIDSILQKSAKPPVIMFMGDHGFREFQNGFEEHAPYYYMNLNSVLVPNGNYKEFYDGISGVNQFRALLNTVFHQEIPYLKDSTILLHE